jgi:TP901 family phage tail tape measure protein
MLDLAIRISALDQASSVFQNVAANARAMQSAIANAQGGQVAQAQAAAKQASDVGQSMLTMGAVGGLMGRPILRAFTELEDSGTRLKSVMMDRTGSVGKNFTTLDGQARDLGNRLPGMTADFYKLASTMLALGMSQETLINGGFKSAAYLGVLTRGFGESYQEAGTAVAKFKEALGVSDGDMIKFMDTVQRLRHLGMPLTDMRMAFSRLGGEMKSLGLQGLSAANDIAPLAAYIYKTGTSGQITGSSLNSLMRQLAMMPLLESKKAFQNQAQPILQNYGIKLNFVDDQGQFQGIQNMVKQMDKLKKLTALERSLVINAMVGSGGDANAMKFMIGMGTTGYDQMKSQLTNQADLSQRVESVLKTQTNTWDALEGTVKNTMAVLGEGMAPALKGTMNYLNGAAAGLGTWMQAHPRFVAALGTSAFALTGFMVVVGGTAFVLGKAIPFLINFGSELAGVGRHALAVGRTLATMGAGVVGRLPALGAQLAGTAPVTAMRAGAATVMQGGLGNIAGGFGTIARSVGMMNIALLTSPAFLVIAGLAVGAVLIIQNWQVLSAFFRGFARGVLTAFAEPIAAVRSAFAPIMPIIAGVFRLIAALFTPIQATAKQLDGATSAGRAFGAGFGAVLRFLTTPLIWLIQLVGMLLTFILRTATGGNVLGRVMASAFMLMVAPIMTVWNLMRAFFAGVMALFNGKTWTQAGKIAIDSLWNGMAQMFGKILDGVKAVAGKVMDFFGMGSKNAAGSAAQTGAKAAQTAQTASSTPKPPPTPPQLPAIPTAPRPPVQAPRRMVVRPATVDNEQLRDAANHPGFTRTEASTLQAGQIADEIMDVPRVSYAPPPQVRVPRVPRSMPRAPVRPALMRGDYQSGTILSPSVPHTVDGIEYMSTPIDMGQTSNPNRAHRHHPRKKAASSDDAETESGTSGKSATKHTTKNQTTNAPLQFSFSFNFAGAAAPDVEKDIRRAIEDKLPEIERAVRDSLKSTRLQFSY